MAAWQKIPMIAPQERFHTSEGPMKEWFDLAREIERRPGVLTVSTFPMQPWLDARHGGWSALVYTDGDPDLARALCGELASKVWDLREGFWQNDLHPVDETARLPRRWRPASPRGSASTSASRSATR